MKEGDSDDDSVDEEEEEEDDDDDDWDWDDEMGRLMKCHTAAGCNQQVC